MSNIVERLAVCEEISEWIDPWDKRLDEVTGEGVPNDGGSIRENWEIREDQGEELERQVKRLIVRELVCLRGLVTVEFSKSPWANRVLLNFTDPEDWRTRFPTERAVILEEPSGRSWAAVGRCGTELGLAVFASELSSGASVEARVQPVPDQVFGRILQAM